MTGRIVFAPSKGLIGVGLPRKARKTDREAGFSYGLETPEREQAGTLLGWEDVRDLPAGSTVSKTFWEDTCPAAPVGAPSNTRRPSSAPTANRTTASPGPSSPSSRKKKDLAQRRKGAKGGRKVHADSTIAPPAASPATPTQSSIARFSAVRLFSAPVRLCAFASLREPFLGLTAIGSTSGTARAPRPRQLLWARCRGNLVDGQRITKHGRPFPTCPSTTKRPISRVLRSVSMCRQASERSRGPRRHPSDRRAAPGRGPTPPHQRRARIGIQGRTRHVGLAGAPARGQGRKTRVEVAGGSECGSSCVTH
jgi:hypothetical protein